MASVMTDKEKHQFNHDVSLIEQEAAAKALKKGGASVRKVTVDLWEVNNEIMTPRTLVEREKRGHYAIKKESSEGESVRVQGGSVQIPRYKRRSTESVDEPERVDRSADERERKQTTTRGNGRGSRVASRRGNTGNKKATRKAAPVVRKQRQRVPAAKADNAAGQTRVAGRRKPSANLVKSRKAKRSR